jgi:hypothetical protein
MSKGIGTENAVVFSLFAKLFEITPAHLNCCVEHDAYSLSSVVTGLQGRCGVEIASDASVQFPSLIG